MSTKFIRFMAALAVIISIAGNTGVASADRSATPTVISQNIDGTTLSLVNAQRPLSVPKSQPLNIPALTIPPASSLGIQFVQVATAANSAGDWTTIDHPLTNGKPDAIIFVTQNYNPGNVGSTYDKHPIGVFYTGTQWAIFNQDLTAIPVGAAFNVIIPTPSTNVFVHTTTVSGSYATQIDNPLANGNPNAIVLVTPNYDKIHGVCGCVYSNFPIGVRYNGFGWAIYNQTGGAILDNASFNVFVLTAGAGVFVHTATLGNRTGDYTMIDSPLTNGNPNAIVFVTPDWNPGGGVSGTDDNHNIGVWYDGSKWAIFNQDLIPIPLNAAFNVLVLVPSSDIFVHPATAENTLVGLTKIDNALTNSHPNAIVFATSNWNPGGFGTIYNNHNIGVFYRAASTDWGIFTEDNVAMPVNAMFNVLIPNPDTSVFVHKATATNISGYITTIDYPLTNGKPNAILLVTPNYDPGGVGAVYDDHPIGVYYTAGKWTIFNEDLAAMPVGATFNVFVPTASAAVGVLVHTSTAGNSSSDYTRIDNPLANNNRNAIVLVTPNYDPGGVCPCQYSNYRIGVWYTGSRWAIFNQDGSTAVPVSTSFNVYVDANYNLYLPLIMR